MRPRLANRRLARAAARRAGPERAARPTGGVWVPVLTLLLGSLLTLGTTVVAGRLSAADDRARERDSFLRSERLEAYGAYAEQLHVINARVRVLRDALFGGGSEVEPGWLQIKEGIVEEFAILEEKSALVEIVGSERVSDAAGQAAAEYGNALVAVLNAFEVGREGTEPEREVVYADISSILACSMDDAQDSFVGVANADLGASPGGFTVDSKCVDRLDEYYALE